MNMSLKTMYEIFQLQAYGNSDGVTVIHKHLKLYKIFIECSTFSYINIFFNALFLIQVHLFDELRETQKRQNTNFHSLTYSK